MKDLLKNAFLLYGKVASTLKKLKYLKRSKKIGVNWQEYGSSLKFDFPQISVTFSIGRKKTWNEKTLFPVDKKIIFTSRNEGLAEKYVLVEEKTAFTGSS